MRAPLLLLTAVTLTFAQSSFEYWPGAQYDSAIPTQAKVLGFETGERIAWANQAVQYLEALAKAAPSRMKLFDYGKTWEGRRLVYAVIGSEANLRRLPEIQAGMTKLHDPRTLRAGEAQRLLADLPAITWLAYSVHGNESSGTDASLITAYHLLASKGDALIDKIFANTLVIIDPSENPDGRDRFIHNYETNEGLRPDPEYATAEHNEQWPAGRVNHYLFDLNRDWLAITQPETAGRVRILREWYPQVFVDLHEMGTDSLYYFAPDAVPYNPNLTGDQKAALTWFGQNNAKYFDKMGFSYFTREVYDAFYPGYGASWPAYFGAIAMTYENGATRGLAVRRSDEVTVDFRYVVRRHFTTSIATCETVANNRKILLDNFYKYSVTAMEEGAKELPFILPRRGNVANVDRLALLLVQHGVEVKRATAAFQGYPAGTYVIPLNQPGKRLARTLLDTQVSMDDNFVKAEEVRRKQRKGSEIYDVTAWSLPLQFGVECLQTVAVNTTGAGFEAVKDGEARKGAVTGGGSVAYLVPWTGNYAALFLTRAIDQGLRVHSSDRPFQLGTVTYPRGTLVVKTAENPKDLRATVEKIAASTGADVTGVDTSWTDDGPSFGSRYVTLLKKPRIALAWDRPVSAGAAGATRFVLERQFGYPVSAIRTAQFATADLSRFNVIILPDGGGAGGDSYASVLNATATRKLKEWVQAGGTLIGVGAALQYLGSNGFLSVQTEGLAGGTAASAPAEAKPATDPAPGKIFAKEEDYQKAIQPEKPAPDSAHGVLARAKMDPEHWLSAGAPETVYTLVAGRTIYTPLKADKGTNVGVYAAADQVMASGYLWDEYRKQLAFKPFVVQQKDGRGNIIGFTSDPNYRAYMDGLNLVFLNAVFRGPAH